MNKAKRILTRTKEEVGPLEDFPFPVSSHPGMSPFSAFVFFSQSLNGLKN
jgi:hypothetical protein